MSDEHNNTIPLKTEPISHKEMAECSLKAALDALADNKKLSAVRLTVAALKHLLKPEDTSK